jgi:hypothetical protein
MRKLDRESAVIMDNAVEPLAIFLSCEYSKLLEERETFLESW